MAKVILIAEEMPGDEDVIPSGGVVPGEDEGTYETHLKEPDPSSLKPAGGEPRPQVGHRPLPEQELEGLTGSLTEEPEKFRDMPTKLKVWTAVTNFNPLWIRYVSLNNHPSERTLSMFEDPKAGIFWGKTTHEPYITAWDDLRNNWSRFRVNKIEEAKVLPRAS